MAETIIITVDAARAITEALALLGGKPNVYANGVNGFIHFKDYAVRGFSTGTSAWSLFTAMTGRTPGPWGTLASAAMPNWGMFLGFPLFQVGSLMSSFPATR